MRFCGMRIAGFEMMGRKRGMGVACLGMAGEEKSGEEWFCSIFFLFFLSDFQRKIE